MSYRSNKEKKLRDDAEHNSVVATTDCKIVENDNKIKEHQSRRHAKTVKINDVTSTAYYLTSSQRDECSSELHTRQMTLDYF